MRRTIVSIVVLLLLSIPQVGNSATPANDDHQNAMSIGDVIDLAFDTTEATVDGPEACMTSANVWYCYTAPCTGVATVSLCGSNFDTRVAVYYGCGTTPTLSSMFACNDDFCGRQSEVVIRVTKGNKYLIEVGGYNVLEAGTGVLNISCDDDPDYTPPNDNWFDADSVGNVYKLKFDTTDATLDGPGDCVTHGNVWFCYTAPKTDEVTVSLCGSEFDTVLAVYEGCNVFPRWDNRIECNDDFCDRQSQITFNAIADQEYLIEVGGWSEDHFGSGLLTISSKSDPLPPPKSNDDCQNAKLIGDVTDLAFNTNKATFDGPGHCMTSPNVWYLYVASCTGEATVSLCGSSYDTKLAVYDGGGCNPSSSSLIECNDDYCGWQSQVTFEVIAGNQYLIEVGGFGSNSGEGLISVACDGTTPLLESDLGDAPDSTNNFGMDMTAYPKKGPSGVKAHYPTVYIDGNASIPVGPIHLNSLAVAHLGKSVTTENKADLGPDQDVVNNIDPLTNTPDNDKEDDGVVFPVNMPHCDWTTLDYIVKVITPNTDLWINIWCDWNRDGDWDDDDSTDSALECSKGVVSEWAVQNQYLFDLPAGLNQLTTPAFLSWHPDNASEEIWMRITLSEKPWVDGSAPDQKGNGGSGPRTGYEIGETEDYYFIPGESQ